MALDFLLIVLIVLVVFFAFLYYKLRIRVRALEMEQEQLKFDHKSMAVKHGYQFESFVPFMEHYPGEKENTVFLGKPVDFISFDHDYVKFIEVKTGKSQLNDNQKRIKELIEQGKVKWFELRFDK